MEYEGRICRPDYEKAAFKLPVAVGCSYNACKFCGLFKHLKFRVLPREQVEAELARVRSLGGDPNRVMLGDGNPFCLPTEDLLWICGKIHEYFPSCTEIRTDSTISDIARKSDDELRALNRAGITMLYLGIECAEDDVLKAMLKDHITTDEAEAQINRLFKASEGSEKPYTYTAHIMTGICGTGRGEANAHKLAAFFERTRPAAIVNFSVFLHRQNPLGKDIEAGVFLPADELENLREIRTLISELNVPLKIDSLHDFAEFRVRGELPADKDAMLAKLDEAISRDLGKGKYSIVS